MTKDKDLKRLVRARMDKTGESYTTARARLLAQASAPLPVDYEKVAGMSDDAVRKASGRSWPQWTAALDEAEAASMAHRAIAEHLEKRHGVSRWWAQMIAVAYERFRGLRDVGQGRGGSYRITKTRTIAVPVSVLWRAFADDKSRARWTGDIDLTIHSANEPQSIRLGFSDGKTLEARFSSKGEERSSVSMEQGDLPDKESADRWRKFWGARLDDLQSMLTPP